MNGIRMIDGLQTYFELILNLRREPHCSKVPERLRLAMASDMQKTKHLTQQNGTIPHVTPSQEGRFVQRQLQRLRGFVSYSPFRGGDSYKSNCQQMDSVAVIFYQMFKGQPGDHISLTNTNFALLKSRSLSDVICGWFPKGRNLCTLQKDYWLSRVQIRIVSYGVGEAA